MPPSGGTGRFHNDGAGRLGLRGDSAGVVEQLDAALDAPGHGDSKELAVRMAHDAAPELGDLCLVEPVLLVGAEVVGAVREVDGHYRAVVAHQKERAAEALFLPGAGMMPSPKRRAESSMSSGLTWANVTRACTTKPPVSGRARRPGRA